MMASTGHMAARTVREHRGACRQKGQSCRQSCSEQHPAARVSRNADTSGTVVFKPGVLELLTLRDATVVSATAAHSTTEVPLGVMASCATAAAPATVPATLAIGARMPFDCRWACNCFSKS